MIGKTTKTFAFRTKDVHWNNGGLRPYFAYRNLGINHAIGGEVLAHVIRPTNPQWHLIYNFCEVNYEDRCVHDAIASTGKEPDTDF